METILKIKFDYTFYLFLLLIILTGMFKQFTFIFLLLFFHELGHALIGLIYKWPLVKIIFYPYGGLTIFNKPENSNLNQEILILLAGPLFQTITYFLLKLFFSYDYLLTYHLTIIIFNFLPILSLDGGKLLNIFLNKIFNYQTSFKISIIISCFTIFSLIIFCFLKYHNLNLFLMAIFMFFKIIKAIKDYKYYYQKFLLERYLYNYNFKKLKAVNNINKLYKESNHFINFLSEKAYLNNYFNNK